MYWSQCPTDIRFWPILGKWNWYNRSKYKDFWMGPSVKFVSRINGSFSPKNNGSIFFSEKRANREWGWGSEGGLSKGHNFSVFFPRHPPLIKKYVTVANITSNKLSICSYEKIINSLHPKSQLLWVPSVYNIVWCYTHIRWALHNAQCIAHRELWTSWPLSTEPWWLAIHYPGKSDPPEHNRTSLRWVPTES